MKKSPDGTSRVLVEDLFSLSVVELYLFLSFPSLEEVFSLSFSF